MVHFANDAAQPASPADGVRVSAETSRRLYDAPPPQDYLRAPASGARGVPQVGGKCVVIGKRLPQ